MKKDPRIDTYIRNTAPFARPILKHLRKVVHRACPQVEETLKWGMPHFMYGGKILCGMGAFKAHCIFGFWQGALIVNDQGEKAKVAMGQLGRITQVSELPRVKQLVSYINQAMKLNEPGAPKMKRPKKNPRPPLKPPADFTRALKSIPKALANFKAFSPSHQREYIEWITEAKTEETRERRLETAVDWITAGKSRHWKYQSGR